MFVVTREMYQAEMAAAVANKVDGGGSGPKLIAVLPITGTIFPKANLMMVRPGSAFMKVQPPAMRVARVHSMVLSYWPLPVVWIM